MICTPGYIWGGWSKEAYKRRATGGGATLREGKKRRVSCAEFSVMAEASSLKQHMDRQHVISVPQTREVVFKYKIREDVPEEGLPVKRMGS